MLQDKTFFLKNLNFLVSQKYTLYPTRITSDLYENINLGCNELSCTGWGVCEAACNSVGVRRRTCADSLCDLTQQCTGPRCGKLGLFLIQRKA